MYICSKYTYIMHTNMYICSKYTYILHTNTYICSKCTYICIQIRIFVLNVCTLHTNTYICSKCMSYICIQIRIYLFYNKHKPPPPSPLHYGPPSLNYPPPSPLPITSLLADRPTSNKKKGGKMPLRDHRAVFFKMAKWHVKTGFLPACERRVWKFENDSRTTNLRCR